ncbi:LOW QUALITY PROTEIN: hypothetical protein U9M48_002643 [Paspalum notatum var. saurae]|uniref:Integrase catalytic domain-containing protein n=1 Tax=Paspalum notatum var. saurae TaxID=547442 RepID=A0AAQ3PRR7_PASNO
MAEYVGKMRALADELTYARKTIDDDELISYILSGLGYDYNPIMSPLVAMVEPISFGQAYSQLLSYEHRVELQHGDANPASANAASRGRGGNRGRGNGGCGRNSTSRGSGCSSGAYPPRQNSNFSNRGGYNNSGSNIRPKCQLCGKRGHTVINCWHRFDEDFTPDERGSHRLLWRRYKLVHGYRELEKLTVRDKYKGHDQIHTASGAGMKISHIGYFVVKTPTRNLHPKYVLHVPRASKNLVSVHRLAPDNSAFLEFHPDYFFIKDQATKKTLLKGRCHNGLYPLPSIKRAYGAVKPSIDRWHSRLGHPAPPIVERLISQFNLPWSNESNKHLVCDACQKAKSHRLPYLQSHNISSHPLELVYSDVWGPAPNSVSGQKYYVSFIDDYSKFTWIYLLKFKSDVFQKFHEFQSLVERLFNRKIVAMQTDWGGEYQRLHDFFSKVGITHHVSCPHAHQQNGAAERKHRHIVEVGLALLAQACMPLKFWGEAFLTAVYLINRTPSRVIEYSTPLERLFHQQPDYSSLRVFGCACWPNLRPYNRHKLQFGPLQCVFLGYSPIHKGFKCLDPSSGKVYISRDVTFDESIFPFQNMHPNAGQRLHSEISLLTPSLLNPLTNGPGVSQLNTNMSNFSNDSAPFAGENTVEFQEHSADNGAQTEDPISTNTQVDPPAAPLHQPQSPTVPSPSATRTLGEAGHLPDVASPSATARPAPLAPVSASPPPRAWTCCGIFGRGHRTTTPEDTTATWNSIPSSVACAYKTQSKQASETITAIEILLMIGGRSGRHCDPLPATTMSTSTNNEGASGALSMGSSAGGFTAALKPSEPFDGTVYNRWRSKMILWLTAMHCFHVVKGKPEQYTPEQEIQFEVADNLFRGAVISGLADKYVDSCLSLKTCKALWDALEEKFGVFDAGSELYILEQLYDYEMFSVADLIGTLDIEEKARAKDSRRKGIESSSANMNNLSKPKQTATFKKEKTKKGGCFVCGSTEHWASACLDRKFNQEKKSANMVVSGAGKGTFGYGNSLPTVLSVCHSPEWWADTGANIHVCADISLFSSYLVGGTGALLMGNGSHARVLGVGTIVLKFTSGKTVLLKKAQHVPSIKKNLVSGSQMCRDGYKLVFESNKCVQSKYGTFVGKSYDCGGLFRLSLHDDV